MKTHLQRGYSYRMSYVVCRMSYVSCLFREIKCGSNSLANNNSIIFYAIKLTKFSNNMFVKAGNLVRVICSMFNSRILNICVALQRVSYSNRNHPMPFAGCSIFQMVAHCYILNMFYVWTQWPTFDGCFHSLYLWKCLCPSLQK